MYVDERKEMGLNYGTFDGKRRQITAIARSGS
jgi:hypothetical protein